MLTNWTLTWCIWHQLNLTCISKRENLVQHIERSLHRLLVISPAERWHWEGARAGTPGSYWGQSQREGAGGPEGSIRTDQRDRPRKGTAQEGGGHPAFQSSNVWHGEVLCRNTGVWKNTCSYHVWVSLSCDHCLSKSVWNVTVHVLLILGIILLDGFFPPLWSLQAVFFFFPRLFLYSPFRSVLLMQHGQTHVVTCGKTIAGSQLRCWRERKRRSCLMNM